MSGIIAGAAVLFFLLVVLVWILGWRAKRRLATRYPPPGQLVDVGGYRLHIHCQGDPGASPTVVLDAGQGEPGLTWASVQPEVARFARVCTYDRAGLGWSEASPKARTASNIVEELGTLLARAGVPPPYVLVGHSAGGLYARLYAHQHPGEVVGMVLVDAASEELDVRAPESLVRLGKRANTVMGCSLRFLEILDAIGFLALVPGKVGSAWFSPIPESAREPYMGLVCSDRRTFAAMRGEVANQWGNLAEVRAQPLTPLGEMPLVVLSRDLGGVSAAPGVSAEDMERFHGAEKEMQAKLASLSSQGKQIIAEACGHYIQVQQPELVIDAIREVVEAVQPQR